MKDGRKIQLDDACNIEYGTRVVKKRDGGSIYPVYGGGGATFYMDDFNREDRMVIARFGISEECTRFVAGRFFLNDSGLTVSPKNGALIPRFLDYQILSLNDEIYALGKGTAQKNLDVSVFRTLPIFIPSIEKQRHIVAIFDEAFDDIATAKANAEKNLGNARSLFENYLQIAFTKRGEEWATKKLGDLCDQITDGTHNSPPYVATGIPMLDSKHVKDGFVIDDSEPEKFISPATDTLLAKRCKPRTGDILISSRGSIGKIAIVREGQDFNIMGNMILIRFPANINREFAAFYLHSQVTHIESIARGVAQKGLYLNQIREYEFPLPSQTSQAQIGNQLDNLSAETQHLESIYKQKLAALDALKKSLLHRAFTGEL